MTLELWIDPADDNVVTLSGSRITDIADKSLEGNDISEVTTDGPDQGTVQSLNTIAAQAATDRLTLANASISGLAGPDFTVIVAFTDNGDTNVGGEFNAIAGLSNDEWDATGGWRIGKIQSSSTIRFSINVWTTNFIDITGEDTVGEMAILSCGLDASADYMDAFKNGSLVGVDDIVDALNVTNDLTIGYEPTLVDSWVDGEVGDVIYYNRKLRSDETQRVEGYLAHKWNIASKLPVGHPFKNRAPDIVTDCEFLATFSGSDGDTTYTAETGQVATALSNVVISDLRSKYGNTAAEFDGADDAFQFPDSTDLELGSGDFTLEAWVSPDVTAPLDVDFMSKYNATTSNREYIFGTTEDADGELRFLFSTDGLVNTSYKSTDAPAFVLNEFTHVAVVRRGNVLRMFWNGVVLTLNSTAITGTAFAGAAPFLVGNRASGGAGDFDGLIDSVRLTKQALYWSEFTPPHRGFRLPVPATLIANFNGADAATTFTSEDAGARTATFVANAQLDTAEKKFGISSALFDGTGDYVSFPDSADWEIGSGDFSLEFNCRFNGDPGTANRYLIGHYTITGAQRGWLVDLNNNELRFSVSPDGGTGSINQTGYPWNPTTATWYHIQVERYDGNLYIWVDGVLIGTEPFTDTPFAAAAPFTIGGAAGAGTPMNGWIDGVRFTKGTALKARILPPEALYENTVDDSALLINFDGVDAQTSYVTDDASGRTLVFNGTELDSAQRWLGATSLEIGTALTDYCEIPDSASLTLGSGDFTIEFMFRPSQLTTTEILFDNRATGTDDAYAIYVAAASNDHVRYYVNGADRMESVDNVVLGEWTHIVIERVGLVTTMYMNGVWQDDWADSTVYIQNNIRIGNPAYTTGNPGPGNYDMVRISVGKALYGGHFDLPPAPPGEPIV